MDRAEVYSLVTHVKMTPFKDDNGSDRSAEEREAIRKAAAAFRSEELYKRAYKKWSKDGNKFYTKSPKEVHYDMVMKLATAPNDILRQSTIMLMIPILDDRLDGKTEMTPPTEVKQE